MKDYILFIPPLEIAEKKVQDWSVKEAKLYFDWFISTKDDRVEYLLTAMDEELTNRPEEDMKRIGEKVTKLLFERPFSEKDENEPVITNKGLALVADLSLLISQLVILKHPQIIWKIVKAKKNVSYNLPAMFEFPMYKHMELIGAAIVNAKAILRGEKTASIWVEMYTEVVDLIK
jgi:hypothetical protein